MRQKSDLLVSLLLIMSSVHRRDDVPQPTPTENYQKCLKNTLLDPAIKRRLCSISHNYDTT